MSEALRLPARPNIEQYRKLAKDFQRAYKERREGAIRDWAAAWLERAGHPDRDEADAIARQWQEIVAKRPALAAGALTDAQFFLAQIHGFSSWPVFAAHIEAMARESSGTALFESAVDAIVSGDATTLERLLREHPDLVRARSTRAHGAALLHYVSANGVEDFRQKTPRNVVEIARMLLDAGADVDAESNSYTGHDTTLLLAATSVHPENAGVQIPLLELLIGRGARMDVPGAGSDVNACLHNGRGRAAEYLAEKGASLDLEGAAGVGRLDVVRQFVAPDGALTNGATERQRRYGQAWAAQDGRTPVVEYLLDAGLAIDARLPEHDQTALHSAAWGRHPEMVRLLLRRGAPVVVKDRSFEGTPLDWAIYAWGNRGDLTPDAAEGYYEVVRLLARAGASIDPHWLSEEDAGRGLAARRLQADPRMLAALKGQA